MSEKLLKDIENRKLCENDMVFYSIHKGTLRDGEVGIILEPNVILSSLGKIYNLSHCYKIEKYNSPLLKQLNESLLDIKFNYIKEKQNFKKYGLIRGGVYRYNWQDISAAVIYLGKCKLKVKRDIIEDEQVYVGPLFLEINMQYLNKEAQKNYNYYLNELNSNIYKLYNDKLNRFMKEYSSIYSDISDFDILMEDNSLAIDRFVFKIQNFKTDNVKYDVVIKGKTFIHTIITFITFL